MAKNNEERSAAQRLDDALAVLSRQSSPSPEIEALLALAEIVTSAPKVAAAPRKRAAKSKKSKAAPEPAPAQ